MLNEKNERELCYVVEINDVQPIEGRDRVECAVVNGWTVMVRKNQFKPGDLGIYFEIDSLVPATEPFAFLIDRKYRIKTQSFKTPNGHFLSQGLLMSASDFDWGVGEGFLKDSKGNRHYLTDESRFLTSTLGVTYYDPADRKRKASSVDKYKVMAQRHHDLFRKQPFKWLMQREWGKKLLFIFFGKKKDKKNAWPQWVAKTDEERIQNMPWILEDKEEWIATEKIDGTSTTFTMKRGKFGKNQFFVCSRNVVFDKPDKQCFYDVNVYTKMAEKYNVENFLTAYLNEHKDVEWVTLQGETYGADIQKRDYGLADHEFAGFNFIDSVNGRWNSVKAKEFVKSAGIPWVPIISEHFILPDTVDDLLRIATNQSRIDGGMREGLVFRSKDGVTSFKRVSNEFLLKYHND